MRVSRVKIGERTRRRERRRRRVDAGERDRRRARRREIAGKNTSTPNSTTNGSAGSQPARDDAVRRQVLAEELLRHAEREPADERVRDARESAERRRRDRGDHQRLIGDVVDLAREDRARAAHPRARRACSRASTTPGWNVRRRRPRAPSAGGSRRPRACADRSPSTCSTSVSATNASKLPAMIAMSSRLRNTPFITS